MRATSKVFYSIATYLFVSLVIYVLGVNFVRMMATSTAPSGQAS